MSSELCTPSVKCFDNNLKKKWCCRLTGTRDQQQQYIQYKEQVTVDRTDAHAGKGRDRAVHVCTSARGRAVRLSGWVTRCLKSI